MNRFPPVLVTQEIISGPNDDESKKGRYLLQNEKFRLVKTKKRYYVLTTPDQRYGTIFDWRGNGAIYHEIRVYQEKRKKWLEVSGTGEDMVQVIYRK